MARPAMNWRTLRTRRRAGLRQIDNGLHGRRSAYRLSVLRQFWPESLPHHSGGLGRRERVPTAELGTFPYASICRIWGDRRDGTGFLVEGGRILTAGHIVIGAQIRSVQFPGRAPFQVRGRQQIYCHPQHRQDGDLFDYGIITPPANFLSGVAALPLIPPTDALLATILCEVAGYAQEFAGQLRYPPRRNPPVDTRAEVRLANGYIEHKFDTTSGQSGSPVLARTRQNPDQWFAIGMHIWGAGDLAPGFLNRALPVGGGLE